MVRIPQPISSETNHGQYEDVFNISMYKDGLIWNIDDYAPRANLKKMFKEKKITSKDHEQITQFSSEFIVESEAVIAYIQHLEQIKMSSGIKSRERENIKTANKEKCFEDFKWDVLISTGEIKKLTIPQLHRYIHIMNFQNMEKKRTKSNAFVVITTLMHHQKKT